VEEGQRRIDKILSKGDSAEAHLLLGNQMFAARDYPASVKELQRAIELNPAVPGLQSLYGQALLNTGDPDAAAEAFRKELAIDPNDFDSNLHLAEILIARKQFAEATQLMDRALRVRPQEAARELRVVHDLLAGTPDAGHGPATGDVAPALNLKDLTSGQSLTFAELSKGEPVLLVFGSYTCPNLRAAAESLNRFYGKYKGQVAFYLVYIREAHSTADWQSTRNGRESVALAPATNMTERAEHATLCVRKLHFDFPALLDNDAGSAASAYAAWPSRVYMINANGSIVYQTGLNELDFKPDDLEIALRRVTRLSTVRVR
jgi:tetratricopeptide (TPR) repeat protein